MNAQDRIDAIVNLFNEHAQATDDSWKVNVLEFDVYASSFHAFVANAISGAVSKSTDRELKMAFQEKAL